MVDSPDRLCTLCLRKISSALQADQHRWKQYVEACIAGIYRDEQHQSTPSLANQQKRKYHRGEHGQADDDASAQPMDDSSDEMASRYPPLFLEHFLQGLCPLNSTLSERLATYLVQHDLLNDFTLTLFSSNVTCLRRVLINVKYLSRLQCHIFNQHPNLVELELVFKDSNRTMNLPNERFYQRICPSNLSNVEDIYAAYGPFILPHGRRRTSASSLSDEFSHHKLLNVILTHLHPLTIARLKVLSLSHYKFFGTPHSTPTRKYSLADMSPASRASSHSSSTMTTPVHLIPTNLRLLLKLTNLTSLNLCATDIKSACLDVIIESLPNVDTLDLSLCRSVKLFTSLLKLVSKLKWLNLYNCRFHLQINPSIYDILYQLKHLEYLDISNDTAFSETHPLIDPENGLNRFLRKDNCLPRLKHLDLSGHNTISSSSLRTFLLHHQRLQFLGLFLTNEKYSPCVFDSNDLCYWKHRRYTYDLNHLLTLNVLTEADAIVYEPFLIEALSRYRDRSSFVQKVLHNLFFLTRSFDSRQQVHLIELIVQAMSIHSSSQPVQMASTACIYNLTRSPVNAQIHVKGLAQIIRATMDVMSMFPNQQQLQKNCLLTLCSDRILHEPQFDFCLLATLVMTNLQNYADLAILQPGVAILSLLTTRLSIAECAQLGSISNIQRVLELVDQQIERLLSTQTHQPLIAVSDDQPEQSMDDIDMTLNHAQLLTSDDTLRFCLSLLWNLTDENPPVCESFIHSTGLRLFQRLLHLFAADTIVLTKIVGLLSNIAEVPHLRIYLYSIDIISLMQKYLSDSILDVAFSATGVLAHLLCEQPDDEINWDLCEQMRRTILTWNNPHTNMVTYRSFKPFAPLLYCARIPVVQLWAVWAMYHVFSTDLERYNGIIREEQLPELMASLYDDPTSFDHSDMSVVQIVQSIIHLLPSPQSQRRQSPSALAS